MAKSFEGIIFNMTVHRPVTGGAQGGEDSPRKFLPPWRNVLDIA